MSGNQKLAYSQDMERIDFNDTYEMRNWCTMLRCSEEQLENAIRAVGNFAADVRKYLTQ